MTAPDCKLHRLWQPFEAACQNRAYGLAIQSLAQLDEALGKSRLPSSLRREWAREIFCSNGLWPTL
jgi:hypothetical protein